jgi:hypothetical protein
MVRLATTQEIRSRPHMAVPPKIRMFFVQRGREFITVDRFGVRVVWLWGLIE